MWEDLPESKRCGCWEEGKDRQAVRCVLLPASQILQDSVNLLFFAESLKERQQVQELCVIHVIKPGLDWNLGTQGNHVQLDFVTKMMWLYWNTTTGTQTVINLN